MRKRHHGYEDRMWSRRNLGIGAEWWGPEAPECEMPSRCAWQGVDDQTPRQSLGRRFMCNQLVHVHVVSLPKMSG